MLQGTERNKLTCLHPVKIDIHNTRNYFVSKLATHSLFFNLKMLHCMNCPRSITYNLGFVNGDSTRTYMVGLI